jgi:hypothetical protein
VHYGKSPQSAIANGSTFPKRTLINRPCPIQIAFAFFFGDEKIAELEFLIARRDQCRHVVVQHQVARAFLGEGYRFGFAGAASAYLNHLDHVVRKPMMRAAGLFRDRCERKVFVQRDLICRMRRIAERGLVFCIMAGSVFLYATEKHHDIHSPAMMTCGWLTRPVPGAVSTARIPPFNRRMTGRFRMHNNYNVKNIIINA